MAADVGPRPGATTKISIVVLIAARHRIAQAAFVRRSASNRIMQTFNSRLISALLLFVLLLMLGASFAQSPREPFNPGETLTYDVMWTIFRAGSVSATIRSANEGNHATYEVTASARSEGFVSLGFDVNDVFKATSSAQTL